MLNLLFEKTIQIFHKDFTMFHNLDNSFILRYNFELKIFQNDNV